VGWVELGGTYSTDVEMKNVEWILIANMEEESFERISGSWCEHNKVEFKEVGCEKLGWIQLARDTLQFRVYVNTVQNIWTF
jgi:hypothetical protein